MKRLKGDPIGARCIKRRHINARDLRQIAEQLRSGQSIRFGLRHHQTDFGQQLLTVTQGDEVKEWGIGLWIAGGGGTAAASLAPSATSSSASPSAAAGSTAALRVGG